MGFIVAPAFRRQARLNGKSLMNCRRRLLRSCLGIATALVVVHGPSDHAEAAIRTVALTGQQAPGAAAGVTFNAFTTPPRINNAGRVAFESSMAGTGVTSASDTGLWSEGSGSLALIAREGDQAPGMPAGVVYLGAPFQTVLNNAGQHVLSNLVTGPGINNGNNQGIWSDAAGALTLVARSGTQAPGAGAGVNFSLISSLPSINDAGQILFDGALTGVPVTPGNNSGAWLHASGVTTLLARKGGQAPGMPAGVTLGSFSADVLNEAAQSVFAATVFGPGGDTNSGVWVGGANSLSLRVQKGDQAPDVEPGAAFLTFAPLLALNDHGRIAFVAKLFGGGVTMHNNYGLWSDGTGSLRMIARIGSQAPGLAPGTTFFLFPEEMVPAMNGGGVVATCAYLGGIGVDGSNNFSVWSGTADNFRLIAREGDAAPGTTGGAVFANMSAPAINAAGQVALFSTLNGSGIFLNNDRGLWATDRSGQLQLVAREGDSLEVAPGDFRTISYLAPVFSVGEDAGLSTSFNDRGQLAFSATFTDGTRGAFVSDRVQIVPGDFNGDARVDGDDLAVWRAELGKPAVGLNADADGNGRVDGLDFLAWQGAMEGASAMATPEPGAAALALIVCGCFAWLTPRRRGLTAA